MIRLNAYVTPRGKEGLLAQDVADVILLDLEQIPSLSYLSHTCSHYGNQRGQSLFHITGAFNPIAVYEILCKHGCSIRKTFMNSSTADAVELNGNEVGTKSSVKGANLVK